MIRHDPTDLAVDARNKRIGSFGFDCVDDLATLNSTKRKAKRGPHSRTEFKYSPSEDVQPRS